MKRKIIVMLIILVMLFIVTFSVYSIYLNIFTHRIKGTWRVTYLGDDNLEYTQKYIIMNNTIRNYVIRPDGSESVYYLGKYQKTLSGKIKWRSNLKDGPKYYELDYSFKEQALYETINGERTVKYSKER